MSKDPRASGMSWLTPYLVIVDVDKTFKAYEKVFGFEKGDSFSDDKGNVMHAEMKYKGNCVLMFCPESSCPPDTKSPVTSGIKSVNCNYVYTDDVDALAGRALEYGMTVTQELTDQFWGDRTVLVTDENGYQWMFATHTGKRAEGGAC